MDTKFSIPPSPAEIPYLFGGYGGISVNQDPDAPWIPPIGIPAAIFLPTTTPFKEPGYEKLADVLSRAFDQAARGKGKERHAQGAPFDQQPMQNLCSLYGTGFALGQAAKKAQESMRLPHEAKIREMLGAIVYLAGAIIHEEEKVRRAVGPADGEQRA